MADTHLCSGCDSTFSLRGYQSHLLQTKDPLYRAVFDGLKKSYETYQQLEKATSSSDETMEDTNDLDINMDRDLAEDNQNPDVLQLDDDGLHDDDSVLGDIGDMAAEETGWEQPQEGAPQDNAEEELADIHSAVDTSNLDEEKSDSDSDPQHNLDRYIIGDGYGVKPTVRICYTDKYPSSRAGQPLSRGESRDFVYSTSLGGGDNPWAPFLSKKDWEIARWAKLRGAGSTAFSDLLAIDGVSFSQLSFKSNYLLKFSLQLLKVCESLDLSFKNSKELNKIIDNKLPGRPQFKRREIVQSGEAVELYSRDIIECLRALWGDPEFSEDLILEPERLYADEDMTIRIFHDMNTGNWWWDTQVCHFNLYPSDYPHGLRFLIRKSFSRLLDVKTAL